MVVALPPPGNQECRRRYNKLYSKNPNAHVDDETGEESKVDALEILAEKLRTLLDS